MNERLSERSNHKIDWEKFKKEFIAVSLIFSVFIVICFSFSYLVVTKQNKIRETVSEKPVITTAKVISIHSGKGVRAAQYEFIVNGERIIGSTFNRYNGVVGDQIRIKYYLKNPSISLYCKEDAMQSIYNDSIVPILTVFGIMFLTYILAIIISKFI